MSNPVSPTQAEAATALAHLIRTGRPLVKWSTLPSPWNRLAQAVQRAGGPAGTESMRMVAFKEALRKMPERHEYYHAVFPGKELTIHMVGEELFQSQAEAALASEPQVLAPTVHVTPPKKNTLLSADDILNADFPEPVWAVPGLLAAGLTFLAGKPKVGKSWLALQLALSVAQGGEIFGEPVQQGKVLYLALEDHKARLQKRMQQQGWPQGMPVDYADKKDFDEYIGDLSGPGLKRLSAMLRAERYRLVVIDTLSRSMSGDQNDVSEMTRVLSPLQVLANEMNSAIVIIDHQRKGHSFNQDVTTDLLGSTAKGAVSDAALGLYRDPGKVNAQLVSTGRDVIERSLQLRFDEQKGLWDFVREDNGIRMTERREEIVEAVRELGPCQLIRVSEHLNIPAGNMHKQLGQLVEASVLKRFNQDGKILYQIAPVE